MSEAENQVPEWADKGFVGELEVLKSAPFLKDATDPQAFFDQLTNAAGHMGNSIRMPGPDAGNDDINAFEAKVLEKYPRLMPVPDPEDTEAIGSVMQKLGAPTEADGYKLPDGLEVSDDAAKAFREEALELGLTQAQFEKQVKKIVDRGEVAQSQAQQAMQESVDALKAEWGNAYSERMDEIKSFLSSSEGVPEAVARGFTDNTLDGNTLKWLHSLSALGAEEGQTNLQKDGGMRALTPAETQARIGELSAQIFAAGAKDNPRYSQWVAERRKLIAEANPD